jgi:hypothetical protein
VVLDRGTVAAVLVAVSALAIPAQATAAKKKHGPKPDLKVTVLKANLGSPPYVVVGTDGVPETFEIQVTTKNQGRAEAPPSVTDLFIRDSHGRDHEHLLSIPRLKPHARSDRTVVVTNLTVPLGFAQIGAEADHRHHVDESDENNNLAKGERFAVVAKQWNASDFESIVKLPMSTDTTKAAPDLRFVLSRYDHSAEVWVYKVYGRLLSVQSESAFPCSYSGSNSASRNPWADSFLNISGDLGGYDAVVKASVLPKYPIPVKCFYITAPPFQAGFQDLLTFVGYRRQPTMTDKDTRLFDSVTDNEVHTTFKWDFRAAVP